MVVMAEICTGADSGSITTMAAITKVRVAPHLEKVMSSEDDNLEPMDGPIEEDIKKFMDLRRRVCLFAG